MIEQADAVLKKWSHALSARSFYPGSHPAVRNAEADLLAALRSVHEAAGPFAIAVLEDRLLHGNDPLPSTASSGRPIQKVLRASYVDRVTFDPGVTEDELVYFLGSMASTIRGQGLLDETERIRLEYVVEPEQQGAMLQRSTSLVREIHDALTDGGALDYTRLAEVTGGLLAIVASHPHTILPLAKIKEHDEYVFVHTVNVAILSAATAHMLGCTRSVVRDVVVSGVLHDLGKQTIPREILNKPGRLDDHEAAIVRRHPEDGARMLMNRPGIPDMAVIVAYEHHIRSDGTGYPRPPVEWTPHLASRLVQVADIFDALRTTRTYQTAKPVAEVVEIFRREAASFSDTDLVRLFLSEVALRGEDTARVAVLDGPGAGADVESLVERL